MRWRVGTVLSMAALLLALLTAVALAKTYRTTTTLTPTSGGFAGQLSSPYKRCLKGRKVSGTLTTREQRTQLGPVRTDAFGNWLLAATVPAEDYLLQVHVAGRAFPKSRQQISCRGTGKTLNTSAPSS